MECRCLAIAQRVAISRLSGLAMQPKPSIVVFAKDVESVAMFYRQVVGRHPTCSAVDDRHRAAASPGSMVASFQPNNIFIASRPAIHESPLHSSS